jgi:hypothetical protein
VLQQIVGHRQFAHFRLEVLDLAITPIGFFLL